MTGKGARVTMASVAWHVKQQGGVVVSVFDNLRDEAKRIVSMSDCCVQFADLLLKTHFSLPFGLFVAFFSV